MKPPSVCRAYTCMAIALASCDAASAQCAEKGAALTDARLTSTGNFDVQDLSVEGWLYVTALTSFGGGSFRAGGLFGFGWDNPSGGQDTASWEVAIKSANQAGADYITRFQINWPGTGSGYPFYETTAQLSQSAWHHICVTYSGSGSKIARFYFDGTEVDQSATTARTLGQSISQTGSQTGSVFAIGDNVWGSSEFTSGYFDEVRVWNRVLSSAEVQNSFDHSLFGTESGLIAYYRFDQGVSGTIDNLEGNASRDLTSSAGSGGSATSVTYSSGFAGPPVKPTAKTPSVTLQCFFPAGVSPSASLSVEVASSSSVTYQWRRNGTALTDAGVFSGTSTSTLSVSLVDSSSVGTYDVVVTNNCGSTLSPTCSLQAGPAPCNRADIGGIGGAPSCPDGQLTVDDILMFGSSFSDGTGCPGGPPCNYADITDIGDTGAGPDGELTVDDYIAFVNSFSDGC